MSEILELYDRVNAAIDAAKAARDKTLVGMSNARVDHRNKTTARQTGKPSKKKSDPRKVATQNNDFNPNLRTEDVEAIVGSRKGADPADMDRIIESKNPKMVNPFAGMTAKSIIEGPSKVEKPKSDSALMPNISVKDLAEQAMPSPRYADVGSLARASTPKAAEASSRDFDALFKKATGASFDAKSKADRARMAELRDLISSRADLADKSDTKVALAWYASKKK
jgi:hypothetical protein